MPKKEINGETMVTQQEIANEFDISTSAIRKYEGMGLIKATETTIQGKLEYKWYDERTVFRIRLIRMYVEMGESLDQVKSILTDPDFDSTSEVIKLRKGLVKKKAKINRQIAFCDLAALYGVKLATLMTVDDPSAESFMKKVMKRLKAIGVSEKLSGMETTVAEEKLTELDDIVTRINSLQNLSYSNEKVQQLAAEFADKWAELELPDTQLTGNSRLGYRLFYMLSGLMMSLGNGMTVKDWKKTAGENGVRFLNYTFLFGIMQTVNELIVPFRRRFRDITTDTEKEELVNEMYGRLTNWMKRIHLAVDIPESEIKELLEDILDDEADVTEIEEGCEELYAEITEELAKLD